MLKRFLVAGVFLLVMSVSCFAAPPAGYLDTLTITDSTGTAVFHWTDDASAFTGISGSSGYVNNTLEYGMILGASDGQTSFDEFFGTPPASNNGTMSDVSDMVGFENVAVQDFELDSSGGTGGTASFLQAGAVPEPASLSLLCLAGPMLLSRQSRRLGGR